MTTLWVLLILLWIVSAGAASLHLVLVQRRPATAVAWLLAFWALPILGASWYLVFGVHSAPRSIRHRRRRRHQRRIRQRPGEALARSDESTSDTGLEAVLERCSGFPARDGHEVTLLEEPLAQMLDLIARAQREILIETYILGPGEVAEILRAHLEERARAGVRVQLLVDPLGSFELPRRYLLGLQEAGVDARQFLEPGWLGGRLLVNLRNHRKLLLVDDEVACLGSANWADEYRPSKASPGFEDLHLAIRGPAVGGLRRLFLEDWSIVTGDRELAADLPSLTEPRPPVAQPGHRVRVVTGGPDEAEAPLFTALFAALRSARRSVLIVTPYFVPGETMMQAVRVASLSGARVRILMPERSDSRIVDLAARHYFPALLDAGVEIWLREPPFLHAKAVIVDGIWTTVGSANFDERSFHLNYEVNVEISGVHFAAQLERRFRNDFRAARPVDEGALESRGTWRRLAANAAAILEPML